MPWQKFTSATSGIESQPPAAILLLMPAKNEYMKAGVVIHVAPRRGDVREFVDKPWKAAEYDFQVPRNIRDIEYSLPVPWLIEYPRYQVIGYIERSIEPEHVVACVKE